MARPLTESDLIFPAQSLSLSSTLHSLKRSALSITNRLHSISSDSQFIISVSEAYGLPLVANERCGSWYIPTDKKAGSVYFKSTDGHTNEWSFSMRRLNLQLLDLVGSFGGCVIVDSTRRGKSMPDALSKTIPIWCCVMNRALFDDLGPHELYTPPQAVSPSEHAQIEKRIDRFVRHFLDICKPNVPQLRRKLQKPLRPLWRTQDSLLPAPEPVFTGFHPIVLCTASRRVHGGEVSEGGYIQGAADDHEAWAHGLTPALFWTHKTKILETNEEGIPSLIVELLKKEKGPDAVPVLIAPTSNLYISSSQNLDIGSFDVIISCTPSPLTTSNPEFVKAKKYFHLPLATGKLGSRDLRTHLPRLPAIFEALPKEAGNILLCCPTGKDLSVGIALAILCLYTDAEGRISKSGIKGGEIDKTFIKQRLSWITTSSPTLNPSRETLKSVNAYLMPNPSASCPPAATSPRNENVMSKLVLMSENGGSESQGPSLLGGSTHIPVTDLPVDDITSMSRSQPEPQTQVQGSVSLAIFVALCHNPRPWAFTRKLTSKLPTHPSGTVTGTATFTPISSADVDGSVSLTSTVPPTYPTSTLLYSEEGDFVTDTGLRFTARRKYVYRLLYDTQDPHISVYFFDDESAKKGDGIGGLFVEMGALTKENAYGAKKDDEGQERVVWEAQNKEQHLCGEDLYAASWRFGDDMVRYEGDDKWWDVRYDVKGPKKDYVSETRYSRQ